ncbi:MAG: hypothetical protein LCH77_12040 [Actinobacteria bacterium]|nr:hypothetical protein [Actinomycetota bacterium]
MIDLIELYVHWDAGRSQAQLAQSLGLDRKTVRKYLAPVRAAGFTPGGPPVSSEADWRERAAEWFPEVVDKGLRQVTWPAIAVHRDLVTAWLEAGVTVATIHQRLRDEHGLEASVASVRRCVVGNLPKNPAGPRCGSCDRARRPRARRHRSTTAGWGCGPIRPSGSPDTPPAPTATQPTVNVDR